MPKLLIFVLLLSGVSFGQDTDILLNHDLYHYVDRLDIKGLADTLVHTDLKPYGREYLGRIFGRVDRSRLTPLEAAWHRRIHMLVDDDFVLRKEDEAIFKYFFRNRRDFLHVSKGDLQLFINPVLHVNGGIDQNTFLTEEGELLPVFTNARGVQVRGSFGKKLGFHTEVYDNYNRIPQFVYNRYQQTLRIPGEGFIKTFDQPNGVNYFSSRAYLTYSPIKQIRIKFGKDRAFWGNGFQSLILSDHAADPLLLNITTRVWKLEYVSQVTQMVDFLINRNDNEGSLPRKYGAFHMLNFKPNDKVSLGIFESIIYAPYLANGFRGLEIQYLNPLIFYRAIEQYIGSPDNALLGAHVKWNFLQRFQLYGQLILDDYNFGVRNQGSGYWGNKLGWQAGFKYIDFLNISTLDLQVEHNRIRPYTYQHFNIASNYSSYGQSLGHGAGANLHDWRAEVRYHPLPSLNILFAYTYRYQGRDPEYLRGINYGGSFERATGNRPINNPDNPGFDHEIGQGDLWRTQQLYGRISWQWGSKDIFLEVEGRYRQENELRSSTIMGGLRANIAPNTVKF